MSGHSRDSEVTKYIDALSLKDTLERLLGQEAWNRLKDTRDINAWKRELQRTLKMSSAAIAATVSVADVAWKTEASRILEAGVKSLRTAETLVDLFSAFASIYLELSFHQIGLMPNRKGRYCNVTARRSEWKLTNYRSVQYVQDDEQIRRFDRRTQQDKD
ncbi:hypothetical protein [Pararhodobacter oceanensis]|uniref:hypothetical protein n=1 Tax=Pararhodobacter oceanensis TaxID=2172121 RepID=UPI003A93D3AE